MVAPEQLLANQMDTKVGKVVHGADARQLNASAFGHGIPRQPGKLDHFGGNTDRARQ